MSVHKGLIIANLATHVLARSVLAREQDIARYSKMNLNRESLVDYSSITHSRSDCFGVPKCKEIK